jgi:hypothetical protein
LKTVRDARRARNRRLWFYAGTSVLLIIIFVGINKIYIQPLSAPADPPPPGLHLSWAGQPIRGYVETVTTQITSCDKPAALSVELYPAIGRPRKAPTSGRIAFAISGSWVTRMHQPHISLSRHLESPFVPLHAPVQLSINRVADTGRVAWVAFSFSFDPRKTRDIKVSFEADWLSPREDGNSCWLDLPSLMGGSESFRAANEVIGHSEWALSQRGAPLYSAGNYLHDTRSALSIDAPDSIPTPSSLDEPSWICKAESEMDHNCQAFASLEQAGAEASRTRHLSWWTLTEGLLAGLVVSLLLGFGHLVFRIGHFSRPESE